MITVNKNKLDHHTILFSPCAASFDNFKNFEERGSYFNKLITKYFNGKKKKIFSLYYEWWKNIDKVIFSLILLLFIAGLFFHLFRHL